MPAKKSPLAERRPRGMGAAFVYDQIKSRILHLELMPGSFLDETELSKQFGVSRSPVREALIRLSAEGLVQNLRNRTSTVAQFDIAALPAYFDAMELLYRLCARQAAQTPNFAKLDYLKLANDKHQEALRNHDIRSMIGHNREFHMAIAAMGGSPMINAWMGGVLDQGQRLLGLYGMHLPERLSDDILKPHRDMLDAIARKDADAAEAAARADATALIDEFTASLSRRPAMGMRFRSREA